MAAVFFDAGNTLLRMNYAAIAAALATHGVRVTAEAVQRAEWQARVRLDTEVLARRAVVSTESRSASGRYLGLLLEGLDVRDAATVEALGAWRRAYNPPVGLWNTADPDAGAALARLARAGCRAAVISNSNGSVRSILGTLGLASTLEFVIDSSEVGVEKPDPRIFRLALDRAGLRPDEAVYIGDLYSVDVVGARAAGMDAVLLDPGGCWGPRDCPCAPDLLTAVGMVLDGRGPAPSTPGG